MAAFVGLSPKNHYHFQIFDARLLLLPHLKRTFSKVNKIQKIIVELEVSVELEKQPLDFFFNSERCWGLKLIPQLRVDGVLKANQFRSFIQFCVGNACGILEEYYVLTGMIWELVCFVDTACFEVFFILNDKGYASRAPSGVCC